MDRLNNLRTSLKPSPKMPVLFVGHGNPMNAILDNHITREWGRVGSDLPIAQAIVVISAHWQTSGTHITDAPKQPIIYDFYGFPDELYKVTYDANGDPDIAAQLANALAKYEAKLDSQWGLDHGTWSALKHLAPTPEVPVLQISLDINQSMDQMSKMFAELKSLRSYGVIFIGSGNIVHNLGRVKWDGSEPYDWAQEFDNFSRIAIEQHDLVKLIHPTKFTSAATMSVPTDEHYRPMLAAMSLLESSEKINFFNDVLDMGSISMRSFIGSGV
jgi:4,5-DOPA dioxygenase extradiol